MRKILCIPYFIALLFSGALQADENSNAEADPRASIRILKLLPTMVNPLAIEPAIPADYTMIAAEDPPNLISGVLWGKEKDLKTFAKNPNKIEATFISASVSQAILQTGANSFLDEENLKDLEKEGYKDLKIRKLSWGPYPVLALDAVNPEGKMQNLAWVGLNSPDGMVLLFGLLYPDQENRPTAAEYGTWNTFLTTSKGLPERQFLLAYGLDMQEDYTTYSFEDIKVKAYAQKNASDQKMIALVEPLSANTVINISDVHQTFLGTKWNYGKPCVKIDAEIIKQDADSAKTVLYVTLTVLLKTVDRFTPAFEKLQQQKNIFRFEKKNEQTVHKTSVQKILHTEKS